MTDLQLINLIVTLLAIFGAMIGTRKSTEDMRDVLRAEFKAGIGEVRGEVKEVRSDLLAVMQRIENKVDHYAEMQASHSERIQRLERRG